MDAARKMYLKLLSLNGRVAFNDVLSIHLPDAASIDAAKEAIDWADCTIKAITLTKEGGVYIEADY